MRALAVIPVILFHAGFELFSGGFVGVDVFFVISGYLITTILIDDIENNRFSLIKFYERRARRILPVLFFIMLLCSPLAWLLMPPDLMQDFTQSLFAVSLFASNVLFWRQSGYFDGNAEEKPLLHTWSLAVEEQYYLLFPLFLLLAWPFGKKKVFWIIIVMATISLIISEWGWRNKPSANFYLSPSRAWELFAGSISAFIVQKRGVQKNNVLSLIGLIAIIFSIFAYDKTTPFPSIYALVPILGVVLIVLFGDKNTLTAKLLSTRLLVGIGLISYSAYLWHQPLLAFARINNSDGPSTHLITILLIISFVLAFFSWKFIEQPFRDKKIISRSVIFTFSIIGILVFSIIGFVGHLKSGNLGRWSPEVLSYFKLIENSNKYVWERKNFLRNAEFDKKKWKVLIIGDSNSGDLINALMTLDGNEEISFSSLTINSGCGQIFTEYKKYSDLIEKNKVNTCKRSDYLLSKKSLNLIQQANVVIFAASWDSWHLRFMKDSKLLLDQKFGDKFWWLGDKRVDFPDDSKLIKEDSIKIDFKYQPKIENYEINKKLRTILGDRFIDPYDILCSKGSCRVKKQDGVILLYDGFHLTREGAKYFGQLLDKKIYDTTSIWMNR